MNDVEDEVLRLRLRGDRLDAPAPEWEVSPEVADLLARGEKKEAIRPLHGPGGCA